MTRFSDYVTSVGFRLELSKSQLRAFASIALASETKFVLPGGDHQSLESLVRKGLIAWAEGSWLLTKEGKLLVPLLRAAGLLEADIIKHSKLASPNELLKQMETKE